MAVRLYLDVHVDKAIHDQLCLRGVDVLRAQDDSAAEMTDEKLLQHTTDLGRLIFTHDVRFKALAEEWQRVGKPFAGLLFGNQLGVTIGVYVKDLELIAKATDAAEWTNVVQHLPYK
jgi:predicted nuclease of predicted toxin-antitoxin system